MLILGSNKTFDFEYYYDTGDRFVGGQIAIDSYEPFESKLFQESLRDNSILFDIGANIGYYTILASRKINTGRICSFEPNRANHLILEMNILKNKISCAQAYRLAVGSIRGKANLYLSTENQGDHQLYFSDTRATEEVDTIPIDEFSNESGLIPDVVKIDTQGYDYFVISGMKDLIARTAPFTLFTEFWNHGNIQAGVDSREYFQYLQDAFGSVEYIDEVRQSTYRIDYAFVETECKKFNGINHVNLFCRK